MCSIDSCSIGLSLPVATVGTHTVENPFYYSRLNERQQMREIVNKRLQISYMALISYKGGKKRRHREEKANKKATPGFDFRHW